MLGRVGENYLLALGQLVVAGDAIGADNRDLGAARDDLVDGEQGLFNEG